MWSRVVSIVRISCIQLSFLTVFPLLLQCRTPYAAVHSLVLLKMGIMMPETCWDRRLTINIRLVASCWFLSLHPTFMMHGHKSLKSQIKFNNWCSLFKCSIINVHCFQSFQPTKFRLWCFYIIRDCSAGRHTVALIQAIETCSKIS